MFYKTHDEDQKKLIAGSVGIEDEGEIRLGRDACHCACNCFCSCACFKNFLDLEEIDAIENLEEKI